MTRKYCFFIMLTVIIFTSVFWTDVQARRTRDYSGIIKNLDIYGARDWIEINRAMLLDTRVPNDMREQLRDELVLVKQRLEHMRGELGGSEFDKQRGIIIDERIKDIQNILNNYEPGNTSAASRPSSKSIAKEDKVLSNVSILEELQSYQLDVQHVLNRMTRMYEGPNAGKTLKASFKAAGCRLDHWKAWGGWIYVDSQYVYKRQRDFLAHISKAVQIVKQKGDINKGLLNDIRKGMRKWRYDVARASVLLDEYVKICTQRGLAQQKRDKFKINSSKYKASQKKLDAIIAEIPPVANGLKDPKLLDIQVSSKQDNQSKDQDENAIVYDMTLEDMEALRNDILNDNGRFSRQEDGMTAADRAEWLKKIEWMQANIECRISRLALGAEHGDDPEAAFSDMTMYQMYYNELSRMRERVGQDRISNDTDQNPNSIMNQITDYHVATWGFHGPTVTPEELQLLNDLSSDNKSKPRMHKFGKSYIKEVPLKNGKTARMTYVDKKFKKPSKVEIINSSGKPEKVILYSHNAKGKVKRFQAISSKGSQYIEGTKEMIRVMNRDKKGVVSTVKSF